MSFLKLFRDFADGTQIKDRTALESKGFFDEDFKEENFEIIFVSNDCILPNKLCSVSNTTLGQEDKTLFDTCDNVKGCESATLCTCESIPKILNKTFGKMPIDYKNDDSWKNESKFFADKLNIVDCTYNETEIDKDAECIRNPNGTCFQKVTGKLSDAKNDGTECDEYKVRIIILNDSISKFN